MITPVRRAFNQVCQRCRRPSLRVVLIVPFVVQIVVVVGITGYLYFYNSQQVVDSLVQDLLGEINAQVQGKLENYLSVPHTVNRINADILSQELIDLGDLSAVESYLLDRRRQFDDLIFMAVALQDGNYLGIGDREEEGLTLGVLDRRIGSETRLWHITPRGDRLQELEPLLDFDPRQRSWYRVALGAGGSFWAEPFFAYDTGELLLSASERIYDQEGNFVGVVTATLSLEQISNFLSELTIGKTGQAFIVDRQGQLIASSMESRVEASDTERLEAIASSDPMTREVARYIESELGEFSTIRHSSTLTPRINNQVLSVQVHPFQDSSGLDWRVIIVVPRSDFTQVMLDNNRTIVLLCGLALVIAIAIGIRTTRWLVAPVSQLVRAATALSQGDWSQEVDTQRTDEIGVLAQAFDEMRSQLKQAQKDLEQKIAERTQALQESEEKFSKAFRLSPEPLAIVAYESGQILDVNDSFLTLSGYIREEVIGKTGIELNLWACPQDLETAICYIEAQGTVRNMEIQYRIKSGTLRTVLFSAEVIELNREPCVLCVLSDITELKQVEAVLQEAKTAAESANKAKSTFLANMSHELRTPLNAILGFTQVMQRNSAYAAATPELTIISRSGEHLLALINDILDMSKIEAGQTTLDLATFDLAALLTTLEAMLRLRAKSKELLLTFQNHTPTPYYLIGDEQKLRQVLINLLGNAIKFTDRGSVTLEVIHQESPTPPKDHLLLQFTISDTGPGIAEEDVARLFDPFVQTTAGRRSHQGTGLGLAISQTFVQLMGGTIQVHSVLGQGSQFQFCIPMQWATSADIQATQPPRQVVGLAPNQPRYRMLIVDEVPENRLLLRALLEPIGFEIIEAHHGQAAIAQWQTYAPHLIWMDMRMPVMDGYEATRLIKSTPEGKDTIIIALTASALSQDREKILGIGCDDFIRKPFREAEIWEAIAHHLGVVYVYADQRSSGRDSVNSTTAQQVAADDLRIMPQAWIERLHAAAISGDDVLALQLVQAIPADQQSLAIALTELIQTFRLDTLSDLTQDIAASPDREEQR